MTTMAATETSITKRIIVSGITPAITAEDITGRLGSFGTVKAADGFGLLDGVGQPRKFGYVTLETTASKFGRCMNVLSGSTWKGAKLRFGVAKPDYKERLAAEKQRLLDAPPKKRRKIHGPIHAADMSLVTPENASKRPGWNVSELGRVTHPIRLRPIRPLAEPHEEVRRKSTIKDAKPGEKKKKRKLKDPDTRARRKVIDMPKMGSTHLKGMFLDLEVSTSHDRGGEHDVLPVEEASSESGSSSDDDSSIPEAISVTDAIGTSVAQLSIRNSPPSAQLQLSGPDTVQASSDVHAEKAHSLAILSSLFGRRNDDDAADTWIGRESLDSDIDMEDLAKGDTMIDEETGDIEFVPRPRGTEEKQATSATPMQPHDDAMEPSLISHEHEQPSTVHGFSTQKKLKDLFAPREEEAGFSLLGHLDLDLEFDDDVDLFVDQAVPISQEPEIGSIPPASVVVPSHSSQGPIVLDPKKPLFFPLSQSDKDDSRKPRTRDIFDVFEERGWGWRDPSVRFWKTDTDEEIRKQWEETRGDLTRDWKRRWREASKVRKRKKGGFGDGDD